MIANRPIPAIRLRAHILLLLADGRPWSQIAAMLYTNTSTMKRLSRNWHPGAAPMVFQTVLTFPNAVLLEFGQSGGRPLVARAG
jgi:hypothetical protein